MGRLRSGLLVLASGAALTMSAAAGAQIAGGLRAPTSKMEGAIDVHMFACFLASAGRPVPGINLDAPELMGEGLKVQPAAEPWLAEALRIGASSNFATLDTPEGPVWIVFDKTTRACTLALQTADPAQFRASFIETAFARDWKSKKDKSAHGAHFEQKLGGLTFVSAFPDMPANGQVFAVETRTN